MLAILYVLVFSFLTYGSHRQFLRFSEPLFPHVWNGDNHVSFERWLSSKESACNARDGGDEGLIPGLGRSPRGGNGNPLTILAWKPPWTEGAWGTTVHRVTKESDVTEHSRSASWKGSEDVVKWHIQRWAHSKRFIKGGYFITSEPQPLYGLVMYPRTQQPQLDVTTASFALSQCC